MRPGNRVSFLVLRPELKVSVAISAKHSRFMQQLVNEEGVVNTFSLYFGAHVQKCGVFLEAGQLHHLKDWQKIFEFAQVQR